MMTYYANTTFYTTKDAGYLMSAVCDVLRSDTINNCDLIRLGERIKSKTAVLSKEMNCAETHTTTFDYDWYFRPNGSY